MALNVLVKTFDLATGEQLHSRVMPFTRSNAQWLMRSITWACNNGNGVQICHVKDEGFTDGNATTKPA